MWKLRLLLRRIAQAWHEKKSAYEASKTRRKWSSFVNKVSCRQDEKVFLHIGCGEINAQGFINVDARPAAHVHIVTTNLLRLKMIPDNAVNFVYMSHVLEHIGHRERITALREMRRILKDGGVLRISVPDFDKIIDIYTATDRDVTAIEPPLMGGQDYPFNYHYSIFNSAHLSATLLKSGFQKTRFWDPAKCEDHDFDDWASRNISWAGREFPISLNIEAIK